MGSARVVSDNGNDSRASLGDFAKRYAAAAGGALYAFTLGVGEPQNRRLIQEIARRFGHRDGDAPRLPTIEVDQLTAATTSVALPEPIANDGNVSLLELLVLARLVRELQPRRVFEIGTFDGRTTLALAMNAPDEAQIYTLDLPADTTTALAIERSERAFVDKPTSGARFIGTDCARKITQLFGDSATFDFSSYRAELVFVDASHAYEYVLNDSAKALAMLGDAPGVIVWHDYSEWSGVTRALDELATSDARFSGVRWVQGTTLAVLDRRS
jgi:predicted O-methyltransferase YrrM